jgi:hypothetical protein
MTKITGWMRTDRGGQGVTVAADSYIVVTFAREGRSTELRVWADGRIEIAPSPAVLE